MQYQSKGKIIQGVGGRYTIALYPSDAPDAAPLDGQTVVCRARGSFRYEGTTPLPGDDVTVGYDEDSFCLCDGKAVAASDGRGIRIEDVCPRRNELIRPPMANLDVLFVTVAVSAPAPVLLMVDKLISIAEHHHVEPVIVVSKADLDGTAAAALQALYEKAGFRVFLVSCVKGEGTEEVADYIRSLPRGTVAAFAGASGVGKSTLMNALFPSLSRLTGEISQKNARGRHTTREVTLFSLAELLSDGTVSGSYVADTPGFSLLDFTRFDFFEKEDLPLTMREFAPYLGNCRYTDCTHTKEQECAVLCAVNEGKISRSRHESFVAMYDDLKDKRPWIKPPSHH